MRDGSARNPASASQGVEAIHLHYLQRTKSLAILLLLAVGLLFCSVPAARAVFCPAPLPTLGQTQQSLRLNEETAAYQNGENASLQKVLFFGKAALTVGNPQVRAESRVRSKGPFGNLVSMSGPLAAANHYRFSSKEVDPLTGDYYFGFRFYSPNLQRWRNADPIGLWGGFNRHDFVSNDPLYWMDPYGLDLRFGGAGGLLTPGPFAYLSGDTALENLGAGAYNTLPEIGNLANSAGQGLMTALSGINGATKSFFNWLTGGEPMMAGGLNNAMAVLPLGLPEDAAKLAGLAKLSKCEEAVKAADELHHLLPRQFADLFKARGLDPEEFTIRLPKDLHRLTPGGIHTGPFEKSWNGQWENFFKQTLNPSREQILDQLVKMRKAFRI